MKKVLLIPCYNEELTIEQVIVDFKEACPELGIIVYDNNSTDNTAQIAKDNGAIVIRENRQGKGHVIQSMFREIDADVYVMVDGDSTYPADQVKKLMQPIIDNEADMVVGDRLSNSSYSSENKRSFHDFGNQLVKRLINNFFKADLKDIMTGYRVFNKRFVKNIPIMSSGFAVETEMSLHALDKKFRIKEIPIVYKDRPEGSESKLNTFTDGFKVLLTIFNLYREFKPLLFFSIISVVFFVLGILVGIPPIKEYIVEQYVHKVPSAILSMGLLVLSLLLFICGLILDAIRVNFQKSYLLRLKNFNE